MPSRIVIASFYKFTPLPDYRELRAPLLRICQAHSLRGTILLASEGINASVAGERIAVDAVLARLREDRRFARLEVKESSHCRQPFQRMKVRLKREIVALKVDGVDPRRQTGVYIEPKDWNALIQQDDVLLLDARNDYEARMGSFQGALNPATDAFNELPRFIEERLDPRRHKRVAMFCTGGIRCEKASAFMLQAGFEAVYQLKGGILNYLEATPREDSLWQGECFVFDERVSLDHHLSKGALRICDDCKATVAASDSACPVCGGDNFL